MRTWLGLGVSATALLGAAAATAALPPNHQRLRELQAVLADPGVTGQFGMSEPIERVEYIRRDVYRVSAGRCRLDVAIVGVPTNRTGPRQFTVQAGRKVCD